MSTMLQPMFPYAFDQIHRVVNSKRGTNKQETLARLGEALLLVQSVEASFRFVMTFVIQKGESGLDFERWEAQSDAERKKTIGYFLSQLRFRMEVEPHIDNRLATFLDIRNQMVHHLEEVPGWGLEDQASLSTSNDFLTEVLTNCYFVSFCLSGITKSWATQVGFTTQYDDHEVIKIIDEYFVPLAEWSLAAKGGMDEPD